MTLRPFEHRVLYVTVLSKIIKNVLNSSISSHEHKSVEIREDLGV